MKKNLVKSFFRRLILEILDFLFNRNWFFKFLGKVNRKKQFITGLFLMHPQERKYGLYFAFSARLKRNQKTWDPFFSGIIISRGKISLMFSISADGRQIIRPSNEDKLSHLYQRLSQIAICLGLGDNPRKTIRFAGIIPGILARRGISVDSPEAEISAELVIVGIKDLIEKNGLGSEIPLVILGAKGFVGEGVYEKVKNISNPVYAIDKKDLWPGFSKPIIVVDVSLQTVIQNYIELIPRGSTLINEVYPPPDEKILTLLKLKGIKVYHLTGFSATAYPYLPYSYEGAVPFCAAMHAEWSKVITREMGV